MGGVAGGGKGGGGQPQAQGKGMGGAPQNQAVGAAGTPGAAPLNTPLPQSKQQMMMNDQYAQFQAGRPPPNWGGIAGLWGQQGQFMPGGAKAAPLSMDPNAMAAATAQAPGAAQGATPAGAGTPQAAMADEARARMMGQFGAYGGMGMGGKGGPGGPRGWGRGGMGMMGMGGGGPGGPAGQYYQQMMQRAQTGGAPNNLNAMSGTLQGQNALQNLGQGAGLMANGGIVTLPFADGGGVPAPVYQRQVIHPVPTTHVAWNPTPIAGATSGGGAPVGGGGGGMFTGIGNLAAVKAGPAFVAKPQQPMWSPPAEAAPTTAKKYANYGILGNTMLGMIDRATGKSGPYGAYADMYGGGFGYQQSGHGGDRGK